jgi:hypothetical protein
MNVNSDRKYKSADEAKQSIDGMELPDDVKTFCKAEVDRISAHVKEGDSIRAFVMVQDQQTLVHIHPFFEPVEAHS